MFLFASNRINNKVQGHLWLADGFKVFTYNSYLANQLFSFETKTLLHYNFGWGGICDGYYLPTAIDLRDSLDEKYVDLGFGDVIDRQEGLYFNQNFSAITYYVPPRN